MIFVFGAGGFAKEIDWLLWEFSLYNGIEDSVDFFVIEDENIAVNQLINGKPIISETVFLEKIKTNEGKCYLGIGDPFIKQIIINKLSCSENISFPNLIHPNVNHDKRIGKLNLGVGNIVCANSVLTTEISIGNFVQINLACTIGHECTIGNYTTISPGVNVSGRVNIGERVFIGTGVQIIENVTITHDCKIGAGATVVESLLTPGTYIGTPARRIK